MKIIKYISFIFLLLIINFNNNSQAAKQHKIATSCNLKKKAIHMGYYIRDGYKEKSIRGLHMLDKKKMYGKVLRSLRFQNITKAVENRYGLKRNLILAMIMQETRGEDCRPNDFGDGGFGICHMQGVVAEQYGLRTVCTKTCKLRCYGHAGYLKRQMERVNCDRKKMIAFDDRLHPILNLDAVGRILADGGSSTKNQLCNYAGPYNCSKYWKNVQYFMRILNDKKYINKVRAAFNKQNPKLYIAGKRAGFDDYIKTHQDQNINYGLNRYKSTGKCK